MQETYTKHLLECRGNAEIARFSKMEGSQRPVDTSGPLRRRIWRGLQEALRNCQALQGSGPDEPIVEIDERAAMVVEMRPHV